MVRHLHVLSLGELVSQRRDEFRVDLEGERAHLIDAMLEAGLLVLCESLHVIVPAVRLLQLRSRQHERGSGELGRSELQ